MSSSEEARDEEKGRYHITIKNFNNRQRTK